MRDVCKSFKNFQKSIDVYLSMFPNVHDKNSCNQSDNVGNKSTEEVFPRSLFNLNRNCIFDLKYLLSCLSYIIIQSKHESDHDTGNNDVSQTKHGASRRSVKNILWKNQFDRRIEFLKKNKKKDAFRRLLKKLNEPDCNKFLIISDMFQLHLEKTNKNIIQ